MEPLTNYMVAKRDGSISRFDEEKIIEALKGAFGDTTVTTNSDTLSRIVKAVSELLHTKYPQQAVIAIEDIQDTVENTLMADGHYEAAKAYVIYRQKHEEIRAKEAHVREIRERVEASCAGLSGVDSNVVINNAKRELHDGASEQDEYTVLYLTARALIERDPNYSFVASRLLLNWIRREIFGKFVTIDEVDYCEHLTQSLNDGVDAEITNPDMLKIFDLKRLGTAIRPERDLKFEYLGLQTLYDRYLIHVKGTRIEMPQAFFMRVSMGLAMKEADPTARAIEFYELLSTFRFMSSTPTLFNAGTRHSQLSSCYLTSVPDDLDGIFEAYKENALLSKFAGGLGNSWSKVRGMGSYIAGTNGKSQGVIPFLKIVNDTAVAVNQGGKRKGAVCTYLETWHTDIEEFLDLRKNTGDERRRCHDMNTANWIPDLFMKRVTHNQHWTLFSPSDTPDLHDMYGRAFELRYEEYEQQAKEGIISGKVVDATSLWRKMLTMLFETGHPWITFKDACNVRNPQQHTGVIHSSNLCTEITLNTGPDEIAVCNLGSVNLVAHMKDKKLDAAMLKQTINTAMRMLDNVVDVNFYPVKKAETANKRHRPVGLGMMGFQDCLYEMEVPYNSEKAVEFADIMTEIFCYYAYWASTNLSEERGCYKTFDCGMDNNEESLWYQGILPLDTLGMLAEERGPEYLEIDRWERLDWDALRRRIRHVGMRNSNCTAVAPTATIANIVGVTASIEPTFQHVFVKSNLSGDFTVANRYLVDALKDLELWDEGMLREIKYYDGDIEKIDRIPAEVKARFPSAFTIDPKWLIECAARRSKWIDQAQSLNLYLAEPSGKKLDEMYKLVWRRGLKTTYYLRTLSASQTEKYTSDAGSHNSVAIT